MPTGGFELGQEDEPRRHEGHEGRRKKYLATDGHRWTQIREMRIRGAEGWNHPPWTREFPASRPQGGARAHRPQGGASFLSLPPARGRGGMPARTPMGDFSRV